MHKAAEDDKDCISQKSGIERSGIFKLFGCEGVEINQYQVVKMAITEKY